MRYTSGSQSRFKDNWWVRFPASMLAVLVSPITIFADIILNPILNSLRGDIPRVVARRTAH